MPQRRIVQSPTASVRPSEAARWLEDRSDEGEDLILCNQRESADHLARTLADRHGALFGVRRLTLDVLAYRLALPKLVEQGLAPHRRLAEEAVAARAVQELSAENRLGPYANSHRCRNSPARSRLRSGRIVDIPDTCSRRGTNRSTHELGLHSLRRNDSEPRGLVTFIGSACDR